MTTFFYIKPKVKTPSLLIIYYTFMSFGGGGGTSIEGTGNVPPSGLIFIGNLLTWGWISVYNFCQILGSFHRIKIIVYHYSGC